MEIILDGPEVHALRELLEDGILQIGRKASRTMDAGALGELKEKDQILKSIMEKLPVEFSTA